MYMYDKKNNKSDIFMALSVLMLLFSYYILRATSLDNILQSLDHGYQLAIGGALLGGRVPGVDLFTLYGPLIGYVSALGLAVMPGLSGEIIICALGHAAYSTFAVTLLRRVGVVWWLALVAPVLLLVFNTRFYKWYYSFWPLLVLLQASIYVLRYDRVGNTQFRRMAFLGVISAVAFLFRFDLGLLAGAISTTAFFICRPARQALFVYLASALFIMILFYAYLCFASGNVLIFMDFFQWISLASGVVTQLSLPFPTFNAVDSMDHRAFVLFYYGVPLVYLVAIILAVWALKSHHDMNSIRARTLLLCATAGLFMFPQAMHRADLAHLIQVLPIFFVVLIVLVDSARKSSGARTASLGAALVAILVLLPGLKVAMVKGTDLRPLAWDQYEYWRNLTAVPDVPSMGVESADLAQKLRTETPKDATVFYIMPTTLNTAIALSQRRVAGIFPTYFEQFREPPSWIERNVKALWDHPPDVLVVRRYYWKNPSMDTVVPPYDPELRREWERRFTKVLFQTTYYDVLVDPNRY